MFLVDKEERKRVQAHCRRPAISRQLHAPGTFQVSAVQSATRGIANTEFRGTANAFDEKKEVGGRHYLVLCPSPELGVARGVVYVTEA